MPSIKVNAYMVFAREFMKEEEKLGRTFPNGYKDVVNDPKCSERWKSMSDQEKGYYKAEAKRCSKQITIGKKTGLGENVADIERQKIKEQEFKDKMKEYINLEVRKAKSQNALPKLQFHVIHINHFYCRQLDNNEVEYYPAEIAIAEFSIKNGVTRTYHTIVNEPVVKGFTSAAKDHSAHTHNIPPAASIGKSDYKEIFSDIIKFIEPGKKNGSLPPLFTIHSREDVYFPAKSVLSRLAAASSMPDGYLLLYSIEDLFSAIHLSLDNEEAGAIGLEPIPAAMEIKKDPFAYKSGLECEFHNNLKAGSLHCSLSYIKRWLYVICSYCCDSLNIQMISGVHMPKENVEPTSMRSLNSSLCSLTLESRKLHSNLSMTGVSNEYRERVSERTLRDEQRRRAEANAKEVLIIDHSKINNTFRKPQELIERPLRAPFTQSAVLNIDSTDTESIDLSESSFPAIGRGSALKKKPRNPIGLGYADRLKK